MEENYARRVAVIFEVKLEGVELRLEDLAQQFARHGAKDTPVFSWRLVGDG